MASLDLFPKDEELPSFPVWAMEFGATYPLRTARRSLHDLGGWASIVARSENVR